MKKPVRNVLTAGVVLAAAIVIVSCARSSGANDTAATTAVTTEAETAETTAEETTKAETEAAKTTEAETTAAPETTEAKTTEAETTEAETTEAETTEAETAEAETTAAAAASADGYTFVVGDVTVIMGAEAAPILEKLGEPEKTFEQDSCAYQGKDIVYTYKGFELSTYPADGKDCVASVYVLDDTVATAEGIRIGSTADDVREAYKDNYTEEFGVYRMTDGRTELIIYTTNDIVDGIEYLVVTENE